MAASDPASAEEHEVKFGANMKMTGFGLTGVTQHMPCPFCAEPDFSVYRVIDADVAVASNRTCKSCGRSAKCIVTKNGSSQTVELVQTGGEDLPAWYTNPPRRVDV